MSSSEYARFLDVLGQEARSLAMRNFKTGLPVFTKEDDTPVTAADRAIEKLYAL
jgi:3'-phosphoadenosine 5'-phosphosulfate (PAPS) 3'-phosphatase